MKPIKTIMLIFLVLLLQGCKEKNREFSIFCIGDSTMANKKSEVYPETGWCMVLGQFFDSSVSVKNHAVNGRSSKSFIDEGRWNIVLDSLNAGDFVFIQFGHNDEKEYDSTRYTTPFGTYASNLKKFVLETREKGAIPVLFTPIARRKFGENGQLVDTHGDYPDATRKIASENNVPLIDLAKITEEWINGLGNEPSKEMFLWTEPNEQFPYGRKDDTHLSETGAKNVARMALEECKRLNLSFTGRLLKF